MCQNWIVYLFTWWSRRTQVTLVLVFSIFSIFRKYFNKQLHSKEFRNNSTERRHLVFKSEMFVNRKCRCSHAALFPIQTMDTHEHNWSEKKGFFYCSTLSSSQRQWVSVTHTVHNLAKVKEVIPSLCYCKSIQNITENLLSKS